MSSDSREAAAGEFTRLRPLLFTIAYEILGSATEADDVLQDSYLRWAEVSTDEIRDTKSYLASLVTRQSLNALRAAGRRREEYVGPWLPEPLLVEQTAVDAAEDIILAESVSMAMMVVLETLSPDERAVFVLHDVFGFPHAEIASAIGKSAAAVRQLAHRARAHVHARRRRYEPVDAETSEQLTISFFTAAATGDLDGLMGMLAPEVVWTADSDGKASAARRPVSGAERVARLIIGLVRLGGPEGRVESAMYNGAPAFVLYSGDQLEGVVSVEVTDGLITNFYAMRNPEKLASVLVPRPIGR
ncbi:RNA polymerase sigma-70 factor [Mycolicibacterium brumae]|uniref:RNA polymerase sigma-70 factor n=1 Tax=Mycolicibacterium brumae TaxID=85968 RepID=A0A2G5PEV8_9MYCO|nr:RNA polymerase sigma-70 factor [Mycolicibacterium brumae]MCV7191928.1 RNA polymerase sigma-70 factor [Mycolicibacterium brumae]PIB76858.1 RNA polymerase sigma-70 factor [Mycolicibacterium brumae]RWA20598.1 hypothetical protein MBRU_02765 [Mycolicibacterium brumae DSM 44177]UWW07696.1 RNA polymerase sigma-70 factor [Mycolicibacterium brumae]